MNHRLRKVVAGTLVLALLAPGLPASARIALVIGNSSYPRSPLENPANDARAVAAVLKEAGFEVELLLDQKREAMQASIRDFGARLAARKQPSVFYYAGHALQMEWRNYLLPTDINIRTPQDVGAQAVDLNDLMQQLSRASSATGGSSNIVILDACRDNPFGQQASASRGLTQMDAPTGTLLAYATSPGHVAEDAGIGANGLYTENLLKEMRVEGAKIEDVLKRVRLSVRLQSGGRQVPWESTSLEDDFVITPAGTRAAAAQASTRLFEQEQARWERARGSSRIADIEQFMRDYPSGNFSELAQQRLDTLMAARQAELIAQRTEAQARAAREQAAAELALLREREQQIALALASANEEARRAAALERETMAERQAQAEREFRLAREREEQAAAGVPAKSANEAAPAPVTEADRINALMAQAIAVAREESRPSNYPPARPGEIRQGWQNGDLMVYSETPLSGFIRLPTLIRQRAAGVSTNRVLLRGGQILDPFSYPRGATTSSMIASTDMQMLVRDYQLGKKWTTRFKTAGSGFEIWTEAEAKVVARETLTTQAGSFETYKVQIEGREISGRDRKLSQTWWIDTVSRKPIAYDKLEANADGSVRDHRKGVLIAFENDGPVDRD